MKHWKKALFIILGIIIFLFAIGAIYFYFGS
ncbi:hypothetical protein S100892_00145 (plasmid) [Pediococcus pentosaceus]|uniref:Uncharacterized protein n=1 Tax=Pediococcus pentosaceus TaxID=1255 RepID=A0A1Y0VKK4_PEDPE|nr:hypothetical protein S100892_00145 [Pediococcus pentosaceus]